MSRNKCWRSKGDFKSRIGPFTVHGVHHVRPAQKRRCGRREVARRAAATAQDTLDNEHVLEEPKEVEAEKVLLQLKKLC